MYGNLKTQLQTELGEIRAAGLYKGERVIDTPQAARVGVGREAPVLNMCANNYLGLASHPDVIAAARDALDEWGYGLASVRFICGTQKIHKQLEGKLTEFLGTEDTILYTSCFDANGGLFETLLGPEDAVISDELNHASIIDGVRLCKAKRFRYKNNDMVDLAAQLESAKGSRRVLIVTDGVFSMDGYLANLPAICDLADEHGAPCIVAGSIKAIDLLNASTELRDRLETNTKFFRDQMANSGFHILEGTHPITPIMLGDAALASRFADTMLDKGVYVVGFSFPVVPKGKARIRTQISAAHTKEDLEFAIAKFAEAKIDMGI